MNKKNKGFSLVELIVVIVILAILVGVTIGGIYSYVNKARKNTDIQNCETLKNAIQARCIDLTEFGLKPIGIKYAYIDITYNNDDTDYQNMYGHSNIYVLDNNGITGVGVNNTYYTSVFNKVTFQDKVISPCFKSEREYIEGKGASPLAVKSRNENSFFFIIYVDEYGSVYKVKGGLIKKIRDVDSFAISYEPQRLIAYYDEDFKKATNFVDKDIEKYIVYDGSKMD